MKHDSYEMPPLDTGDTPNDPGAQDSKRPSDAEIKKTLAEHANCGLMREHESYTKG